MVISARLATLALLGLFSVPFVGCDDEDGPVVIPGDAAPGVADAASGERDGSAAVDTRSPDAPALADAREGGAPDAAGDAPASDAAPDVTSDAPAVDAAVATDAAGEAIAPADAQVSTDGPAGDGGSDLPPVAIADAADTGGAETAVQPGDAGPTDAQDDDANDAGAMADVQDDASPEAGSLEPTLVELSPASGARGAGVEELHLLGAALPAGAVVSFGGTPVTTTFITAEELAAEIPAALTAVAGEHAVTVSAGASGTDGGATPSNVLYFRVHAAEGAPVIQHVFPDNGVAGDKIRIAGRNLARDEGDPPLVLTDAKGKAVEAEEVGSDFQFTVPAGFSSGPLTFSNGNGSYRGRLFRVAQNLTLASGTKVTASSNWGAGASEENAVDNDLETDWHGTDAHPSLEIEWTQAQSVGALALRGKRGTYAEGYDFHRARLELLAADRSLLWSRTYELPAPDRDLDVVLPAPVAGAVFVRFASLAHESATPGLAEIAVFGP